MANEVMGSNPTMGSKICMHVNCANAWVNSAHKWLPGLQRLGELKADPNSLNSGGYKINHSWMHFKVFWTYAQTKSVEHIRIKRLRPFKPSVYFNTVKTLATDCVENKTAMFSKFWQKQQPPHSLIWKSIPSVI